MIKSIYKKIIGYNFLDLFRDEKLKIPRVIFVFGLLSVVLIASYANYSLNEKDKYRFKILTKAVVDTIYDRLDAHVIILRGVSGIFHEKNTINFSKLDNYVSSLELSKYFPGSLGIGYLPKVTHEQLSDYEIAIRNEYNPEYRVYPEGIRDQYFPVAYVSPINEVNKPIVGLDMFADSSRRAAMLRAARTGLPTVTNKLQIKNNINSKDKSGFHIYLPIYKDNPATDPDAYDDNLKNVTAFVYSPIVASDFFKDIFRKGFNNYVDIKINDSQSGEDVLFSNDSIRADCEECEVIEESIDVMGSEWSLVFTALPAFYSGSNKFIVFILCLGQLVLVFIISSLSYSQSQAKIRAEAANVDKEELLVRERIARGQAEQASRLKEEFLATVSHELRNPLNAILGWAQIINRPNTSQENILKGIKTIEKNVHVQAKLIDDLLEMSRITAGKLILEIRNADIVKVLDSALETVDSALKAKNIKVIKNITPNLPQIRIDETRMQQVIWNLLSNAIKFSNENSTIEISVSISYGHINFSVKDHGAGISPEFMPNIFDRFRQENTKVTKKHGGLGLGLAITKSLIELHGGEIDVKSEGSGKGAEFSFNLPIRTERQVHFHGASAPTDSDTYGRKNLEKMSILVIDDEPDTREMLAVLINDKGASVDCASSVDEALSKIEVTNYDLVISDIGMPDKDGYELARSIRSHKNQNIRLKPIIALSAYARENDRNLSRAAGFSAHLAKPLNVSELFQLIESLV